MDLFWSILIEELKKVYQLSKKPTKFENKIFSESSTDYHYLKLSPTQCRVFFYKTNDFRRCAHHCEWFETKKPKLVSKNQKSPLLLIEASATEFAFDLCTAVTSVNITEDYEIDSSTSNMSNAFVHLWIFQTQFFLASIKTDPLKFM